MLRHLKRVLATLIMIFTVTFCNGYVVCRGFDISKVISRISGQRLDSKTGDTDDEYEDIDNENGEFNFIKTSEKGENIFTGDKLLLYGGVLLVTISILGMIFTFVPIRRKVRKKIKKIQEIRK